MYPLTRKASLAALLSDNECKRCDIAGDTRAMLSRATMVSA
jgi:hypothetical protein